MKAYYNKKLFHNFITKYRIILKPTLLHFEINLASMNNFLAYYKILNFINEMTIQ